MSDPRVETAWAQPARGPGWANWPVWYMTNRGGTREVFCLQPEEQGEEIQALYEVCAAAHNALCRAVERRLSVMDQKASK